MLNIDQEIVGMHVPIIMIKLGNVYTQYKVSWMLNEGYTYSQWSSSVKLDFFINLSNRKCITEGKDVTSCSMDFFRKVKAMCATEFMSYATCLERGSSNMEFRHCRNTQVRYSNNSGTFQTEVRSLFRGFWCWLFIIFVLQF